MPGGGAALGWKREEKGWSQAQEAARHPRAVPRGRRRERRQKLLEELGGAAGGMLRSLERSRLYAMGAEKRLKTAPKAPTSRRQPSPSPPRSLLPSRHPDPQASLVLPVLPVCRPLESWPRAPLKCSGVRGGGRRRRATIPPSPASPSAARSPQSPDPRISAFLGALDYVTACRLRPDEALLVAKAYVPWNQRGLLRTVLREEGRRMLQRRPDPRARGAKGRRSEAEAEAAERDGATAQEG